MSEKRLAATEANLSTTRSQEFDWVDGELKTLYIRDTKANPRLPKEEIARLSGIVQEGHVAQEALDSGAETLSQSERTQLQESIASGYAARNKMVVTNTGLVFRWASHYEGQGVEYLDLLQAGNLGLIRAAEKFDASMGYAFSTYATTWIKSFISKETHSSGRTIRIEPQQSMKLRKLKRIVQDYHSINGDDMSITEMADAMKVDEATITEMLGWDHQTVSMSTAVGVDEDVELSDVLIDPAAERVEDVALDNAITHALVKSVRSLLAASTLDEQSKEIIRMEYGIGYEKPMSQRQIGKELGIGWRKLSMLANGAIEQLRSEASLFAMSDLLEP